MLCFLGLYAITLANPDLGDSVHLYYRLSRVGYRCWAQIDSNDRRQCAQFCAMGLVSHG